ncbi:hypothetical protein TSUD_218690 [Trifolium subterraneum]|uniref:Uncharacterized protein n=1 Tax=Trifolium subterraneum TaxID=3900 RepID=A0A2Z6N8K9_TRISU|nr:hypothetical protein TSUD_218690 [Trifolium subterraneum]
MENYRDVDVHSTETDSSDASSEFDEYNSSENSDDEDGNYIVSAADQSSDDEDVAHNDDDEDAFEVGVSTNQATTCDKFLRIDSMNAEEISALEFMRAIVKDGDVSTTLNYLNVQSSTDPMLYAEYAVNGEGRLKTLFWAYGITSKKNGVYGDIMDDIMKLHQNYCDDEDPVDETENEKERPESTDEDVAVDSVSISDSFIHKKKRTKKKSGFDDGSSSRQEKYSRYLNVKLVKVLTLQQPGLAGKRNVNKFECY